MAKTRLKSILTPLNPVRSPLRRLARSAMFLMAIGALPVTAGVSGAQQPVVIPPFPVTDASSPRFGADSRTDDPSVLLANEKRAKELNVLRQKEMTSDAAKLLLLATELKASVDKEGNDAATPERMHKAEQIEKLARSVRTRMTDAVGY